MKNYLLIEEARYANLEGIYKFSGNPNTPPSGVSDTASNVIKYDTATLIPNTFKDFDIHINDSLKTVSVDDYVFIFNIDKTHREELEEFVGLIESFEKTVNKDSLLKYEVKRVLKDEDVARTIFLNKIIEKEEEAKKKLENQEIYLKN